MTANSPRAMLERLAFAAFLALLIGSVGLLSVGLLFGVAGGDYRAAAFGLGGLLLFFLRPLGYKHLHFRECEESIELAELRASTLSPAQEGRALALAEALNALADLQERGADIWAVQQMRHKASAMLADEPALREVFARELADHPELISTQRAPNLDPPQR